MKKILLTILLLIIVGFVGCTELKRAKVFLPHSWIGMRKVSDYLYVEKSMSQEDEQKIEDAIPKAKESLESIYKEVTTQPIIYACESQSCANSLGLEGKVKGARLLGHLILSNKIPYRNLISHEWSHEELYERIGGFWHWYREIPLWFDEGLASLTIKEYRRHDETAWQRVMEEKIPYPQQKELISWNQWNQSCQTYLINESIAVPYATARHMVFKWYTKVGQRGLLELLEGIKNGEKFEEFYEKEK